LGRTYYVEGKIAITDTNWVILSPTDGTATSTTMTFCIDRPTPYQFFQVVEVGSGVSPPGPPPSGTNVFINPTLTITSSNLCLTWDSIVGRNYYVEGKAGIADPSWTVLSPTNTAVSTTMNFCIDRPTPYVFFQVVQVGAVTPPPPPPPPSTNVVINPTLSATSSNICLTWPSVVGRSYYVEGKAGIVDTNWAVLSPTNAATGATMSFCIDRPTPYQFFQIVEVGSAAVAAADVVINPGTLLLSANAFSFHWTASSGQRFEVEYATNLPPVWKAFTNTVTSTTSDFTFVDDGSQNGGLSGMRFYRISLFP
jgi:hypothetical protein